MDLDKAIFDVLLDNENTPLTYNEIYNMLKDQHVITNTRGSMDLFLDTIETVPSKYHSVHHIYVHPNNYTQEPALVFTTDYNKFMGTTYNNISCAKDKTNSYDDNDEPCFFPVNDLKYMDFHLNNHKYIPNEVKFTEHNCEYLFNLAKSKNTKMMEQFLNLYPKCLYWRNTKGETIMDIACDNNDHDMQNLIAGALVRDKLNEKDDEILKYQDKIAELKQLLIWRTSAGIIGCVFMAILGYFVGLFY